MSKIIIAGTRDFADETLPNKVLNETPFKIHEVVSGGNATWDRERKKYVGADYLGEVWARTHNLPLKIIAPDWNRMGRAAGPLRNEKMAKYADGAIVFWNEESKGSKNMIDNMIQLGKPVQVVYYKKIKKENNNEEIY